MRVLQINTVYQNGGSTGRIVKDLREISEPHGIESYVAYGYNTGNTDDEHTLALQSSIRRKWNILKCRIWPRHGFYNVKETKKLIRWIDEIKPDIIHLHNIHNHYVNVRMLFNYIKQHNISMVWTLHDCWSFTGWCAYFDYAQCDKWKIGCHDCPSKKDYPFTWFFDRSKENYADKKACFQGVKNMTLCPPSKWLGELAKKSFLKDYPIDVINNGVDTSVFKPVKSDIKEKLGIKDKKMILAVVSGYCIRKGADYLKQIPSLLNEDEILVWVGTSKVQVQASDKLICVARTNDVNELTQYYSAADVFINTTLEENFPTVNIEALACGTPIVTFNTGGSIEAVMDNESLETIGNTTYTTVGAVVPQRDLKSMLNAVRKICADGKVMYQNTCVAKANKLYNKKIQYEKYIELYKKIQNK